MKPETVETKIFLLGMSSILKMLHREGRIPIKLNRVVRKALVLYWENGSYESFSKSITHYLKTSLDIDVPEPPLLIYKDSQEDSWERFIEAVYEEIFAFYEICSLGECRSLSACRCGIDSVIVEFSSAPGDEKVVLLG